jgi:hydroxymethylpyrimidine/phosphomethylpyrimidine kinase
MKKTPRSKPVVLVLAGHDPGGGAGIQADIESVAANGCHAATVLTAMTIQNTVTFRKYIPIDHRDFLQQIDLICSDMKIGAVKIGLIGDTEILRAIETVLQEIGDIPVVLDPVLCAGTGEPIMPGKVPPESYEKLLPHITLITPNSIEARTLSGQAEPAMAAEFFLRHGCKAVLITGTHDPSDQVINTLYQSATTPGEYTWPRLPGSYHGSGCTLSSAIAAHLARGKDLGEAVMAAQEYTWNTLQSGLQLGKSQFHPDRYYRY